MSDTAISIRGLSKCYTIAHNDVRHSTLAEQTLHRMRNLFRKPEKETFWALSDVNFDVKKGECVGIIGRNGAGKSTLLKVLSRITEPTTGEIRLYGRVGSLLEVGTGFHPELTGRENIYLNGQILGMRRGEIRRHFDAIVDFAGVEKFLDTPVKRYSSGMYVRLAFAVAAHFSSEILVVDEVLAVGDAEFQRKCLGKMKDVANSGRTVLFVSHNMQAIRTLCTGGVFMEKGRTVMSGGVDECVGHYLSSAAAAQIGTWRRPAPVEGAFGFTSVNVALAGEQPDHVLELDFEAASTAEHKPGFMAIDVVDCTGTAIMQAIPTYERFIKHNPGGQRFSVAIDLPPMIPGQYFLTLWAGSHNTETFDYQSRCVAFEILDSPAPGRTFPHHADHGYVVPRSRVVQAEATAPEEAAARRAG